MCVCVCIYNYEQHDLQQEFLDVGSNALIHILAQHSKSLDEPVKSS